MSADVETSITTGELSRAVNLIRGDIKDVKQDISQRPTTQDYRDLKTELDNKATKTELMYANERVRELLDWQKWAMRVGIPSLIAVIVNTINTLNGHG